MPPLCKICQRDLRTEPAYIRKAPYSGLGWMNEGPPYLAYQKDDGEVPERTFRSYCHWFERGDPTEMDRMKQVLAFVCLDCFDEILKPVTSKHIYKNTRDWPTHLEVEFNKRLVQEVRRVKNGRPTVREDAPVTGYRRRALRQLRESEYENAFLKFHEAHKHVASKPNDPYGLTFIAQYRHYRKLAGVKGRVCQMPEGSRYDWDTDYAKARHDMKSKFEAIKRCLEKLDLEVKVAVKHIEQTGECDLKQFFKKRHRWEQEGWLNSAITRRIYETCSRNRGVLSRVYNRRKPYTMSIPVLCSTSVTLAARLATSKVFKKRRIRGRDKHMREAKRQRQRVREAWGLDKISRV